MNFGCTDTIFAIELAGEPPRGEIGRAWGNANGKTRSPRDIRVPGKITRERLVLGALCAGLTCRATATLASLSTCIATCVLVTLSAGLRNTGSKL